MITRTFPTAFGVVCQGDVGCCEWKEEGEGKERYSGVHSHLITSNDSAIALGSTGGVQLVGNPTILSYEGFAV